MNNINSFSFRHRWDLVSHDSSMFTEGRVSHKVFTETGGIAWLVPKESWHRSFLRRGWQRGHPIAQALVRPQLTGLLFPHRSRWMCVHSLLTRTSASGADPECPLRGEWLGEFQASRALLHPPGLSALPPFPAVVLRVRDPPWHYQCHLEIS